MAPPQSCDVVVIGAGLSGLYAARLLAAAGVDVVVMEAQSRVGGRTLTGHFSDGTFVDDGGQWVSPGQHCIVGLAEELGVRLFPSWSEGATVHWREGARTVTEALFLPEDGDAALAVRESAAALVRMAETLPPEEPWAAPEAAEWDRTTLHSWLAAHVGSVPARRALASAIEGVFSRNSTPTSLLAALFWIRCGDPLTPFLATDDTGPELRFAGGAQQLSERMADAIGERVVLSAPVSSIAHGPEGVRVTSGELSISARRALVAIPPTLAGRVRYEPALPALRDHLTQRVPMRWAIKVHCLYQRRFWAQEGLSGQVVSDAGVVRVCADNSPSSGTPGVLVGFIEEAEASRLAGMSPSDRRATVLTTFVRYFGARAGEPLEYREKNWGDDPFCRGVDGGYWPPGVWTRYGPALRAPIGNLHWAGTETASIWNGKMEGALLAGRREAQIVLAHLRNGPR
jgi:monoamine oxidase